MKINKNLSAQNYYFQQNIWKNWINIGVEKGQIIQNCGIKIGDHRMSNYTKKKKIKFGEHKSKYFQKNGIKISDHLRLNYWKKLQ